MRVNLKFHHFHANDIEYNDSVVNQYERPTGSTESKVYTHITKKEEKRIMDGMFESDTRSHMASFGSSNSLGRP